MRNKNKFERPIIGERAMLMLPLNVVLIGRVNGEINPQDVSVALEKLRTRHPFLAVKVEYDKEDRGYFITENVPAISVYAESRNSKNDVSNANPFKRC